MPIANPKNNGKNIGSQPMAVNNAFSSTKVNKPVNTPVVAIIIIIIAVIAVTIGAVYYMNMSKEQAATTTQTTTATGTNAPATNQAATVPQSNNIFGQVVSISGSTITILQETPTPPDGKLTKGATYTVTVDAKTKYTYQVLGKTKTGTNTWAPKDGSLNEVKKDWYVSATGTIGEKNSIKATIINYSDKNPYGTQ
jgi:hypothetical protein